MWLYGWVFASACALAPAGILLHESAHLLTARCLGWSVSLRAMSVQPGGGLEPHPLMVWAAGPSMELALALAGAAWLWRRRRNRRREPLVYLDWIATLLGCFALRWILKPLLNVALPNGLGFGDEGDIATCLGWPVWALLAGLSPLSGILFIHLFRLHPPGQRWVNLTVTILSMATGVCLWAYVFGPRLFPG